MYGGMGGFGGGQRGPTRFDEQYRVYPVIMMDKGHMEDGDKILLPSSALEAITRMEVDWPIMLKVANEGKGRRTHCGVLEFTATEGCCFMPHWIMQNLLLAEGDIVWDRHRAAQPGRHQAAREREWRLPRRVGLIRPHPLEHSLIAIRQ